MARSAPTGCGCAPAASLVTARCCRVPPACRARRAGGRGRRLAQLQRLRALLRRLPVRRRRDGAAHRRQAAIRGRRRSIRTLCAGCGICTGACPSSTPFRRDETLATGIDMPASPIGALRAKLNPSSRAPRRSRGEAARRRVRLPLDGGARPRALADRSHGRARPPVRGAAAAVVRRVRAARGRRRRARRPAAATATVRTASAIAGPRNGSPASASRTCAPPCPPRGSRRVGGRRDPQALPAALAALRADLTASGAARDRAAAPQARGDPACRHRHPLNWRAARPRMIRTPARRRTRGGRQAGQPWQRRFRALRAPPPR